MIARNTGENVTILNQTTEVSKIVNTFPARIGLLFVSYF